MEDSGKKMSASCVSRSCPKCPCAGKGLFSGDEVGESERALVGEDVFS